MKWLLSVIVGLLLSSSISWGVSIIDDFSLIGPIETMDIPYNLFGGLTSQNTYSGYVVLKTSGSTSMYPGESTDSFYRFAWDYSPVAPTYHPYGLAYSFTGNCAFMEADGKNISNLMSYIDQVGFVSPNTIPDYSVEHQYLFIINVGENPIKLTLGPGDGGVWDNSGRINARLQ